MNATGTFFSVLLAHCLYKNDRLSVNKALGCSVGFLDVMVVNFSAGLLRFDFSLLLVCFGIWLVTREEKPALAVA